MMFRSLSALRLTGARGAMLAILLPVVLVGVAQPTLAEHPDEESYAYLHVDLADSPDPVVKGEKLTYTTTVTNDGSVTAVSVEAVTFIPRGATFVSGDFVNGSLEGACAPDEDGPAVRCQVGNLAVGESASLEVIVRPGLVGELENGAYAAADNIPPIGYGGFEDNGVSTVTTVSAPRFCTIAGTESDDHLFGTPGKDVICAFGGADRVYGKGGNDVLYGGEGRDGLLGEAGNDVLYGGGDDDVLLDSVGRDRVSGGAGNDFIDVRDGEKRDVARGGRGRDGISADRGDRIKRN